MVEVFMAGRMSKARKTIKQLVFSTVAISLSFAFLEIFMIVAEPYLHRGFFEYDVDLGFRIRPGARDSNSFGFNDREYDLEPAPGVLRILFVGDSFSWRGGVEHNYTAMLERKFERHYGQHRVDIVNGGYPMTHTGEHVLMLEKYGLQYNPHIVFLGFYLGNDFINHNPHRKKIVVWDTYLDIDPRQERILLGYPIVAQSRLMHFFRQNYAVLRSRYEAYQEERRREREKSSQDQTGPQPAVQQPPAATPLMPTEKYLRTEGRMLRAFHHPFRDDPRVGLVRQSVSEMLALVGEHQAALHVGLYPAGFQVDAALFSRVLSLHGWEAEQYDVKLLNNLLVEHLEQEGIAYVDLTPRFRDASAKKVLYLPQDTHWNLEGNKLAASILFEELASIVDRRLRQMSR